MALANKRRRHAPEQRRRIFRRNHHGSSLRAGGPPIPTAIGAAESVLTAGNNIIAGRRDGRRGSRRSRCRPSIRTRAKGFAHDISQQRRPRILPRGEREANLYALRRANGALTSRSGADLHLHPRTTGEKRFLTRGKRSSIFQQHAQRALRQKLGKQSQGLPRLDHPQLRQPIEISPDHSQHRHFRAGRALKRADTRRHALPGIADRGIKGRHADAGRNASGRHAIDPERPRFARSYRRARAIRGAVLRQPPTATNVARLRPLALSASAIKPRALATFQIGTAITSPLARSAQQRLALKTRDERPAVTVQLPQIAHPGAERGNRHAHERAATIRSPFPIRHRPIGIRQQHHIICNRSIHARHSSAPP